MTDFTCPRCASSDVHVPDSFELGASDVRLADRRQMGAAWCSDCDWSQEDEALADELVLLERAFFDAWNTGPMREACSSCDWLGEPGQHIEEDRCPGCRREGVMTGYYGDPTAKIREGDLAEGWAWRWLPKLRGTLKLRATVADAQDDSTSGAARRAAARGRTASRPASAASVAVSPPEERVVAAALLVDGTVWTLPPPARHHNLIHTYCEITGAARIPPGHDQGFVTSAGRFVTRGGAATLAFKAGQTGDWRGQLLSEDLW